MYQKFTLLVNGHAIAAKVSSPFSNIIHVEFFDEGKHVLKTGYKSQYLGIEAEPFKRIAELGEQDVLGAANKLFRNAELVWKSDLITEGVSTQSHVNGVIDKYIQLTLF